MKKIKTSVLKETPPDKLRLLLITKSFVFNEIIGSIRQIKDKEDKKQKIKRLSELLYLPEFFTYDYVIHKEVNLEEMEAQQNIFYVSDNHITGRRRCIKELGVYIKIDPNKPNRYYHKLIRQVKSTFEFSKASKEEQDKFMKKGGRSTLHFLDETKAKKSRYYQHGYDLEQDVEIYLECEKMIAHIYSLDISEAELNMTGVKDTPPKIKHGFELVADEKFNLDTKRVQDTYYRICQRYRLPILKDLPSLRKDLNP